MSDVVKVRLKFTPHEETVLKGGEREKRDLQRQGLLYEGSATTDEGAARAVEREQAKAAAEKKENG